MPTQSWCDNPEPVRLGVLAIRGSAEAGERWLLTADYLSKAVPGHRFSIVPLDLNGMEAAVKENALDFVLTNPGNYVELEAKYGVSRLATLKSLKQGSVYTLFGAVIFSRRGREDIQSLGDLKGKSFMAVSARGFGGFQMAWYELRQQHIDPFSDFRSLEFAGLPQDKIVYAVRNGVVDAGTVRGDIIERMAEEGKIDLSEFTILNKHDNVEYPFLHSTRLYPEWPFAKLKYTPDTLAQRVAVALLTLQPESPAAQASGGAGWTIPLDYNRVHELFMTLGIGPYEQFGSISLWEVIARYWQWLAVIAIAIAAMSTSTYCVTRSNRRLCVSERKLRCEVEERERVQAELAQHRDTLELRVAERTRELAQVNQALEDDIAARKQAEEMLLDSQAQVQLHQTELAHVSRLSAMGEMASGLAHELNTPLTAVVNYTRACSRLLSSDNPSVQEISQGMADACAEAERAAEIIWRLRELVRKSSPRREALDINEVISAVIPLVQQQIKINQARLRLNLATSLPEAYADRIQIEQVVINLLVNGLEAMAETPVEKRLLTVISDCDDAFVKVTVADSGRGLPPKQQEKLFDPFYTTKEDGMGMGLSISQSIIQAHGGRLGVATSAQGKTEFEFILPVMRQ